MIRAVLFDLDDTLYYEMEYVSACFLEAARVASSSEEQALLLQKEMLCLEKSVGRGKIFDMILEKHKLPCNVSEMVSAYRNAKPELRLYEDAEEYLVFLQKKGILTGLITDGGSLMQHNKIDALGLNSKMDVVLATDDLGLSKPDERAYEYCLEKLAVSPKEAVYVGDNPTKDFLGARKLGMKTVRILRRQGMHIDKVSTPEYEADITVHLLTELIELLEM